MRSGPWACKIDCMGLIERLRGRDDTGTTRQASLVGDAAAMREVLDGLRRESGAGTLDVREAIRDLLEGEVEAPTSDVADLRARRVDPDDFYRREIAPSWEGRDQTQRAARVEGFIEMCRMIEENPDMAGVPPELLPSVRTRSLLLAFAFDEEYGYFSRLARGELD
jgi:hypothetical protein